MKLLRTLLVVASLAVASFSAQPAVLQVDPGGKLTGASGVNVAGTLYSVTFRDGSCISLFSGCDASTDFMFTGLAEAMAAATALMDQVFLDSAAGAFDTYPNLTTGCSAPTTSCQVYTPYAAIANYVHFSIVNNGDGLAPYPSNSADWKDFDAFPASVDTGDQNDYVYAVWSEATAVNEPGAPAILALGLAVMAVARRRRDRNRLRDV